MGALIGKLWVRVSGGLLCKQLWARMHRPILKRLNACLRLKSAHYSLDYDGCNTLLAIFLIHKWSNVRLRQFLHDRCNRWQHRRIAIVWRSLSSLAFTLDERDRSNLEQRHQKHLGHHFARRLSIQQCRCKHWNGQWHCFQCQSWSYCIDDFYKQYLHSDFAFDLLL